MTDIRKETIPRTANLPPGTLVHIGQRRIEAPVLSVIEYDPQHVREYQPADMEELAQPQKNGAVRWVNLDGIHDLEQVERLGAAMGVHPLVLEDIVNTSQRPKLEDYGDYLFLVFKMLYYNADENTILAEQVSLILRQGVVASFQEAPGDVFGAIRDRIRTGGGRIRTMPADYLAYALLDAVVDNYFVVLEHFAENIELLEDRLIEESTPEMLEEIYVLKRETSFLRKAAWPMRELAGAFDRTASALLSQGTRVYLRDLYDHAVQVVDTVELFRESASGMLDVYLSNASNRMNEVMKVLTIIATIFIPLTFIAGVYGMNFRHMPELDEPWAYPVTLTVMAAVAAGMLMYFRKKRWL